MSYSRDGLRIVSGSWDGTVLVWDAKSGAELRCLRGHSGIVKSMSYSPDGRGIISGSKDNMVRVWDADSGVELRCLRGHEDGVESVSYSPDGRRIVSGSADKTVRVWDAESGAELRCLRGHRDEVTSVSYSPDGGRIVSGSPDDDSWYHTVRVWDTATGECLEVIKGIGDLDAIIRVAEFSGWLAKKRGHELVFEHVDGKLPKAWFPEASLTIAPCVDNVWAAWKLNHFSILRLEGGAVEVTAADSPCHHVERNSPPIQPKTCVEETFQAALRSRAAWGLVAFALKVTLDVGKLIAWSKVDSRFHELFQLMVEEIQTSCIRCRGSERLVALSMDWRTLQDALLENRKRAQRNMDFDETVNLAQFSDDLTPITHLVAMALLASKKRATGRVRKLLMEHFSRIWRKEHTKEMNNLMAEYGVTRFGGGRHRAEDPSAQLRELIEKLRQDPANARKIALRLHHEDPQLFSELAQWLRGQQQSRHEHETKG